MHQRLHRDALKRIGAHLLAFQIQASLDPSQFHVGPSA
jgi:hypothetical protein